MEDQARLPIWNPTEAGGLTMNLETVASIWMLQQRTMFFSKSTLVKGNMLHIGKKITPSVK